MIKSSCAKLVNAHGYFIIKTKLNIEKHMEKKKTQIKWGHKGIITSISIGQKSAF